MPATSSGNLKARCTGNGLLIAVVGRATMRESWVLNEFVASYLATAQRSLTIDLSRCEYLDSTFAGCLIALHKHFHAAEESSLTLIADPPRRKQLLGSMRLEPLFKYAQYTLPTYGDCVELPGFDDDRLTLVRHVLQCHRELAEVEGPEQSAFVRLVERLEQDLQTQEG